LRQQGEKKLRLNLSLVEAQKAKVRLAESQVKQAKLNLSYARITVPVDGYVPQKNIEPSQFVTPGQRLLEIVPLQPPNVWLTANFKET